MNYDSDTQELVQKIKEILCSCPPEMIQKRGNNFICNDDCNICNTPRLINLIKEEKAITTNKWKDRIEKYQINNLVNNKDYTNTNGMIVISLEQWQKLLSEMERFDKEESQDDKNEELKRRHKVLDEARKIRQEMDIRPLTITTIVHSLREEKNNEI